MRRLGNATIVASAHRLAWDVHEARQIAEKRNGMRAAFPLPGMTTLPKTTTRHSLTCGEATAWFRGEFSEAYRPQARSPRRPTVQVDPPPMICAMRNAHANATNYAKAPPGSLPLGHCCFWQAWPPPPFDLGGLAALPLACPLAAPRRPGGAPRSFGAATAAWASAEARQAQPPTRPPACQRS